MELSYICHVVVQRSVEMKEVCRPKRYRRRIVSAEAAQRPAARRYRRARRLRQALPEYVGVDELRYAERTNDKLRGKCRFTGAIRTSKHHAPDRAVNVHAAIHSRPMEFRIADTFTESLAGGAQQPARGLALQRGPATLRLRGGR